MPGEVQDVYEECVFDVGSTGQDVEVCDHGKSLADKCLYDLGMDIAGWRDIHALCSMLPPHSLLLHNERNGSYKSFVLLVFVWYTQ